MGDISDYSGGGGTKSGGSGSPPPDALAARSETIAKVFDCELPSAPIAVMAATAIRAAINPYSTAVVPL